MLKTVTACCIGPCHTSPTLMSFAYTCRRQHHRRSCTSMPRSTIPSCKNTMANSRMTSEFQLSNCSSCRCALHASSRPYKVTSRHYWTTWAKRHLYIIDTNACTASMEGTSSFSYDASCAAMLIRCPVLHIQLHIQSYVLR